MQQCFILQFRLLVHRALPRLDTTSEVRAGLAMYGPVHKKDLSIKKIRQGSAAQIQGDNLGFLLQNLTFMW